MEEKSVNAYLNINAYLNYHQNYSACSGLLYNVVHKPLLSLASLGLKPVIARTPPQSVNTCGQAAELQHEDYAVYPINIPTTEVSYILLL